MSNYQQILKQHNDAQRITKYGPTARKVLRNARGMIAADTETTGLLFHTPSYLKDDERWVDNPYPFGLSMCINHGGRLRLLWGRCRTPLFYAMLDVLACEKIKAWHNMKYDLRVCKTNNIPLGGDQVCTLTMSRIYWDRRQQHSLQALSEFICPGVSDWEEPLKAELKRLKSQHTRAGFPKDYVNYSFLPDAMIGGYSMTDVFMVYQLAHRLVPIMCNEYAELFEREIKTVRVVIKIEEAGMGFDAKRGRAALLKNKPRMKKQWKIVESLAPPGITTNSAKLIEAMRFLGVTDKQLTDKGKVTTGADVLRRCLSEGVPKRAERFIKALLEFRALQKVTNTYLGPLTEQAERTGGRVYTTINPTDSRTGRPASTDPNLLNIPKPVLKKSNFENDVRACFVPAPGCAIYYFDVSQQEMAMFGLLAEDERILSAYERGEDLHQYMAEQIGWGDKRDLVKNINFGVLYGMGIKHMAVTWGMLMAEAKENMKIYLDEFPSIRQLQRRYEKELKENGYVEDMFGRRYHLPSGQAYKAVNAMVQGGCAQAFKIGLLNVQAHLDYAHRDNAHIILPVYDEIQVEVDMRRDGGLNESPFCRHIIEAMTNVPQLLERGLRLRVDVQKTVTNWAEKKGQCPKCKEWAVKDKVCTKCGRPTRE